jgi:hypothetical protein
MEQLKNLKDFYTSILLDLEIIIYIYLFYNFSRLKFFETNEIIRIRLIDFEYERSIWT